MILHKDVEILSDKIFYYKKVIHDSEFIVRLLEKTDIKSSSGDMISAWKIWKSSDGTKTFGYTKSVEENKFKTSSHEIRYIYGSLISAIKLVSKNYAYINNINLSHQSPISISKYFEGEFMGPHTDQQTGAHISGVLYLNDNYSGGELEFPNQNISIKPESGSMIVFPSTDPYTHDPKPAYGSERYICPVFWYK